MVHTGLNEHSVRTMELNSFELTRCAPSGSRSVAVHTMDTPGLRRLKQSFGRGGRNLRCTLSVYYVAAEFATNMVCNLPDNETSWFIHRITNIRSRFGLILEPYRSNLQNSK